MMFCCLFFGPLISSASQLLLWGQFGLRGEYLERIKNMVVQYDAGAALEGGGFLSTFSQAVQFPVPR
ncbi:hypothetical protein T484DRAFT_1762948 [Baffinella frigidus]|nr:hypothetical protein T484DRAFT_1762948 [Cryptophyta sp. CCMP2293]